LRIAEYQESCEENRATGLSLSTASNQQIISELIDIYADPIIKKILNRRLNLYFNPQRRDITQPEAEDLYQTIVLKLVTCIRNRNIGQGYQNIEEIRNYIAKIAHNVCNDYLRMKYPERNRLKSKLRDLIKRHSSFSCWKADDQLLCGYSSWAGGIESTKAALIMRELEENGTLPLVRRSSGKELDKLALSDLLVELFDGCEGPIELERLVHMIASVQGVKDYQKESIDSSATSTHRIANAPGRDYEELETRELLRHLWMEVCDLPRNQRKTFALTSGDHTGESLLHTILREQVVTITQIYNALELNRDELIEIWERLPLDTATAAKQLRTSTHMVAKWRHRSLKRLAATFGLVK
jgi:RNA polymerase sigma factor (sigma-70 family)